MRGMPQRKAGSSPFAGKHRAERQLFQYTIDLSDHKTRNRQGQDPAEEQAQATKEPSQAACSKATQAQTGNDPS